MPNSKKASIYSSNYEELFKEKQGQKSGFSSLIIVIILLSIFTGLFGYYLGDRGYLKSLAGSRLNILESADANLYSQEEIDKKINKGSYDMDLYYQIIANLKDKYVDQDKVQDNKLFEGSLKGLVDSIGDKATNYFSAADYKDYLDSFSGQFEGIGVRLEYQNNGVAVMDVIDGSPAQEAGVQVGYIFYKVDGKDVSTDSVEDVVAKVRGESGTKVKVTFIDPEKKEEIEKEITRRSIKVESMRLVEKDKDTVVFEISRFTEENLDDWKKLWDQEAEQIVSKGYKNIILDLRGNGGGYLDAAIYAANDFLESGKLIVTEKSKVRGDHETASTKTNPRFKGKNVVILVNGGTASASEILSGAIRFHNGYKVIGTRTYGKGTVQNTYTLPNGGAIKITTEYWLLPDGKRLDNDNPINVDTEVKQDAALSRQGRDNVLEDTMRQLGGK